MSQRTLLHRAAAALLLGAVAVVSTSCGEVARTGRSPAFLIIETMEAASGAEPDDFAGVLFSDVQTIVEESIDGETVRVPTIFSDSGRATFRLALKNPGTVTSPLGPSTLNEITLTRFHVEFRRSDGRNTPGVDIPYGFDGGVTVTVPATGTGTAVFDLVRHAMKREPPLRNLIASGGAVFISTIAEITFFGHDQAGNEVTATGNMGVNFGDWADPE